MKSYCNVGKGLLLASILSSAILPATAKTAAMTTKMSSTKMSSTKMTSHKMPMKTTQMSGTILGMTSHSLTVKPAMHSMGMSKTVMIPASAKIMMGAVPTKLSKLKAGEMVTIMMKGGMVSGVMVHAANKTVKGTMRKTSTKMTSKMTVKH